MSDLVFHELVAALGGLPAENFTPPAALVAGEGEPVQLLLQPERDRVLCCARLGDAERLRTVEQLLGANLDLVAAHAWFGFEEPTGQATACLALFLEGMDVGRAADLVLRFSRACANWREAVAHLEQDDAHVDPDVFRQLATSAFMLKG
jgi:hypothetical protein